MDARRTFTPPADLGFRLRTLQHDLQRAKVNLATGKLAPDQYAFMARMLQGRLDAIEAEVVHRMRRNN